MIIARAFRLVGKLIWRITHASPLGPVVEAWQDGDKARAAREAAKLAAKRIPPERLREIADEFDRDGE